MCPPQRAVAIRVDLSDECPACGSVKTLVTILLETQLSGPQITESRDAVYSRCLGCAQVWRPECVTH